MLSKILLTNLAVVRRWLICNRALLIHGHSSQVPCILLAAFFSKNLRKANLEFKELVQVRPLKVPMPDSPLEANRARLAAAASVIVEPGSRTAWHTHPLRLCA